MTELLCEVFHLSSLKGLGISGDLDIITSGSILQYLKETHKNSLDHLKYPKK